MEKNKSKNRLLKDSFWIVISYIFILTIGLLVINLRNIHVNYIYSIIITGFFGLFYFLRFAWFLIKKKKSIAISNFFSFTILLTIVLFIDFRYYNHLAFAIILFIFCFQLILYSKKRENKHHTGRIIIDNLPLILILLFLAIVGLENVYRFLVRVNYNTWQPYNLTWNDFKGIPNDECEIDALIKRKYLYVYNRVKNFPPALVLNVQVPSYSFVRDTNHPGADRGLNHEQLHFDIYELYCRKMKDSLNKSWSKSIFQLDSILSYFKKISSFQNELFDSLTDHGTIHYKHNKWEYEIRSQLDLIEYPSCEIRQNAEIIESFKIDYVDYYVYSGRC